MKFEAEDAFNLIMQEKLKIIVLQRFFRLAFVSSSGDFRTMLCLRKRVQLFNFISTGPSPAKYIFILLKAKASNNLENGLFYNSKNSPQGLINN